MTPSNARVQELIDQLDDTKNSIASNAVTELWSSKCVQPVIKALCSGQVRTAKGRLRALNILHRFGKSADDAPRAYISLLLDRSFEVADNALFGIVFWQDATLLSDLEKALATTKSRKLQKRLLLAKNAIQNGNPFSFAKYFHDVNNVWKLDPVRFRKHIGPVA